MVTITSSMMTSSSVSRLRGAKHASSISKHSLIKGGVSQQPDIIRFPDQVTELVNGFPNEVEGLQKRPPTLAIKRLSDRVDATKKKYHVINRDEHEKYILQIGSGEYQILILMVSLGHARLKIMSQSSTLPLVILGEN